MQSRKKKRESLLDKISGFVEKRFNLIVVLFLAFAILSPVLVWLFYSMIPCDVKTDITADGWMDYLGSFMGSISAVLVAVVAIYQGKCMFQMEKKSEDSNRKKEISPVLQVHVNLTESGSYELEVTNHGKYSAIGIYIFDTSIIHHVSPGETVRKRFSIDYEIKENVFVDETFVELNDNRYPKTIDLIYLDVDNNILSETFRGFEDGEYQSIKKEYC